VPRARAGDRSGAVKRVRSRFGETVRAGSAVPFEPVSADHDRPNSAAARKTVSSPFKSRFVERTGGGQMTLLQTCLIGLCSIAVLLSGCATVPMATPTLDAEAKQFVPPTGKSNVYVFRGGGPGGAIAFQVQLDGRIIGSIAPDTYHLVAVEPGDHAVAASSNENSRMVRFRAVAGQSYFFRIEALMGWASARVGLEQLDDEHGRKGVVEAERAESL
jgi:Protein of unknown function (DUF2846)